MNSLLEYYLQQTRRQFFALGYGWMFTRDLVTSK